LLAAMLVTFSFQQKFDDAQEAVPVETITDSQFSQIMKGEKHAKEATGKPRVDRLAEVADPKPTPPTPEAKRDVPAPPPPMKRLPDPSEAEVKPPIPTPPTPPARPLPPPPPVKPPPQQAKEEPEKDDAEPVKPPTRPKPPEKAEIKPVPKPPEKPVEKPAPKETAKETPKPPKLDEVAKLLEQNKDKPAPNPTPKPKSGEDSAERRPPDLAEISRLLSREAPSSVGAAGRELNRTASLGAPNASAARMTPTVSDALNSLLQEQYKACWNYLALSNGPRYVAKIRVSYRPDGSLAAQPVLTNPPSDPQSRSLADSALRAVKRCNPLQIPARFQPYYEQWKDWVVGFDPDNM
jgi:colicin import membrane protein